MNMGFPALCRWVPALTLGSCLVAAASPAHREPWRVQEARHAKIQKIAIEIGDVFDLGKPDENRWYGRLADKLHASTHENVIRKLLLFQEGDPAKARRIYETERLLRALPFVKDAHIDPVLEPDGTLVARVRVRDAWTTQVNANFASVGGQRTMSLGLDEKNFLGMGKGVSLDFTKTPERSTSAIGYQDPQLFGSRWNLALQDQHQSDGLLRNFTLGRPFYALDTPWSTSVTMSQQQSSLFLYDRTVQIFQAPFVQDDVNVAGAWAFHEAGDRVWRGGVLFDRQDTHYGVYTPSLPAGILAAPVNNDHRLRGPALTLATQKDAFDTYRDLQGMDTPEDYNLAWNGSLELGAYSRALGSTKSAPFFLLKGTSGWSRSEEDLTLLTVAWDGRVPATGLENSLLAVTVSDYHKVTPNQILACYAAVNQGRNLDPERWLYLGGNQGLRGFPNYLHPGDATWMVSCDYRMLTEQRWLSLVRLGYAAFLDAGSVHRMDGLGWSRVYSDAGVELRLGNLKSSLGRVILLSVGVPLNREPYQARYQFTVGNSMQF